MHTENRHPSAMMYKMGFARRDAHAPAADAHTRTRACATPRAQQNLDFIKPSRAAAVWTMSPCHTAATVASTVTAPCACAHHNVAHARTHTRTHGHSRTANSSRLRPPLGPTGCMRSDSAGPIQN